ncbi:hypothetical protein EJP77_07110 [Paenibacillus zeisoli]|uniref:Uncharacterized protein n=1 Tax=Paenibacillus zeisoli TaxID=2496267 RepID=A0A3S1DAF9_9BACL|nr:hypothetical protein [Paenibacillus zeisoli]RUT33410.1 hypothetical protein EJP77_07110 [Paenibacillus zeisoli]
MIEITPPLSRAFRQLGWGFVFTLFNIFIFGVDILPDFIGYILIALALQEISRRLTFFNKAKWTSYVLIIVSLPEAFQGSGINLLHVNQNSLQLNLIPAALLLVHTLLVYWIFKALIAVAWTYELRDLRHITAIRGTFYLIVNVSMLILLPFLMNVTLIWAATLLPICALLSLIAEFLFLRLFYRYAKEYIGASVS